MIPIIGIRMNSWRSVGDWSTKPWLLHCQNCQFNRQYISWEFFCPIDHVIRFRLTESRICLSMSQNEQITNQLNNKNYLISGTIPFVRLGTLSAHISIKIHLTDFQSLNSGKNGNTGDLVSRLFIRKIMSQGVHREPTAWTRGYFTSGPETRPQKLDLNGFDFKIRTSEKSHY